jgi:hypothetical protein
MFDTSVGGKFLYSCCQIIFRDGLAVIAGDQLKDLAAIYQLPWSFRVAGFGEWLTVVIKRFFEHGVYLLWRAGAGVTSATGPGSQSCAKKTKQSGPCRAARRFIS